MGEARNRRLSAVLIADIAGYTRLVEQDTDGTVAAWTSARTDVIDPKVREHAGRVVKYTGDGFLVEFSTVQAAVECAIAMQAELADRPLDFRVGVNFGDVVDDGTDIHGEGVNIAARIEALAEPGGINISGSVYEQVRNRIEAAFEDMGEHEVKHVSAPVRVYRINPGTSLASLKRPADLNPSDKPSIAVLPFQNMSGDPDQEFFADGMTEDIITSLSRFRSLSVVSRNSTLSYKGSAFDIGETAKALGVRYVLEGSVRQGGTRIRISAQLVDAETGKDIWAEKYDRDLDDIFLVQDDVTKAIVSEIAPEIDKLERGRAQIRPPDNLDAWGLYQRGLNDYHESTEAGLNRAIGKFDRVIELDPLFAPAYAMAADARIRLRMHFNINDQSLLTDAAARSRKAIALDDRDPNCFLADARVNSFLGKHDVALSRAEAAIALNPNSAMAYHATGMVLGRAGRAEEGLAYSERAVKLGARDIFLPGYLGFGARLLFELGRYEETLAWSMRATAVFNPRPPNLILTVATLVKLKRSEGLETAKAELLEKTPNFSIHVYSTYELMMFPYSTETIKELENALHEAGLPE